MLILYTLLIRSESGDNYKGFLVLGCNGGNLIIMSISNTPSPSSEVVSVNQVCIDIIYLLYIQLLLLLCVVVVVVVVVVVFNKLFREIMILNAQTIFNIHIITSNSIHTYYFSIQIHDDDIRWIDISYQNNQTALLTTSFDGKSKIWVLEKNDNGMLLFFTINQF